MTHDAITSGITDGQKKQYKRFVEDAAERALAQAGVDKDGLQRLIEQGGEFQTGLVALIAQFAVSNRFVDEEVESSYVYGSGYNGPKPIAEQAAILRGHFPQLGSCNEALATQPVPVFMEGYFAIPPWQLIAPTYREAVERVMAAIAKKRPFYNYREGQLGPQQLKETVKKAKAFERLREQQAGHDILVVAGQFGKRHAGRSVRRAREIMTGREFGFGAYEIAIMLLTHPERLTAYEDLWIDCSGDEAAPRVGETFSNFPYWDFSGGKLKFYFGDVVGPDGHYGSASGCFPECES